MASHYYTIGMAGHIDHGKTTLTKALTNVDTDRLKEEKERNISIELGFAPLDLGNGTIASVVDVPGHEKFIRQMIAGVAGIDLVILVIAADEGVMPQTREHLEILSFLGIQKGIVAITKIDRVDEEMKEIVVMDIKEELVGTPFEDSQMVFVDSLKGIGIPQLKEQLLSSLPQLPKRKINAPFRMPIDQAFTLQGKGTIVRGTVSEGGINEGEVLYLKPSGLQVKARSIQVHNKQVNTAFAGQRAAVNITGVSIDEVKRGDVLVLDSTMKSTQTIDVALQIVKNLEHTLKQRETIKLNVGTTEVMGQIVFFDRKDLLDGDLEQILCQIRIAEPIAVLRGDKFIIRRPSPAETIGGGWIIDPFGSKYRFGQATINKLRDKMEDAPIDRVVKLLGEYSTMSLVELTEKVGITEQQVQEILSDLHKSGKVVYLEDQQYVLTEVFQEVTEEVLETINNYHKENSMRIGMNKAEILQMYKAKYKTTLLDSVLEASLLKNQVKKEKQFLSLYDFEPSYPSSWRKRMESLELEIKTDGLKVKSLEEYLKNQGIPQEYLLDLKHFLTHTEKVFVLDEKHLLNYEVFLEAITKLYRETNMNTTFSLQEAKQALDLSRKYLIMFLEMLDREKLTRRRDEQREWVKDAISKYI